MNDEEEHNETEQFNKTKNLFRIFNASVVDAGTQYGRVTLKLYGSHENADKRAAESYRDMARSLEELNRQKLLKNFRIARGSPELYYGKFNYGPAYGITVSREFDQGTSSIKVVIEEDVISEIEKKINLDFDPTPVDF